MPMENALKVSKRIRRICRKYLSVYGENGKLGLFTNHLRIRGKYLKVFREYAERIFAHMEKTQRDNTPKDIKMCLSWLIIIQILNLDRFFLFTLYVWDGLKVHKI